MSRPAALNERAPFSLVVLPALATVLLFAVLPLANLQRANKTAYTLRPLELATISPRMLTPAVNNSAAVPRNAQTPSFDIAPAPVPLSPALAPVLAHRVPERGPAIRFSVADAGITSGPVIFQISEIDSPPEVITPIQPLYPARAKSQRVTGTVTLAFVVDSDGNVRDISVIDASPPGIFEDASQHAVSRWRFRPARLRGNPVSVHAQQTLRFELRE